MMHAPHWAIDLFGGIGASLMVGCIQVGFAGNQRLHRKKMFSGYAESFGITEHDGAIAHPAWLP